MEELFLKDKHYWNALAEAWEREDELMEEDFLDMEIDLELFRMLIS